MVWAWVRVTYHKIEKPIFMRLRGPKALEDKGHKEHEDADDYQENLREPSCPLWFALFNEKRAA